MGNFNNVPTPIPQYWPPTFPTEPTDLRAGDSWNWQRQWEMYPSSLFALTYIFNSPSNRFVLPTAAVTADADGQTFDIQATSAQTSACIPDTYNLAAVLTGLSGGAAAGQTVTLALQSVQVHPNLRSATGPVDTRSAIKIQLDMLDSALAGDTRPDVQEYVINGRQIRKIPPIERIRLRSLLVAAYRAEQRERGEYTRPSTISFRILPTL